MCRVLILILTSAYFLPEILAQLCDPYGVRVALGYYYTKNENVTDILDIQFNTNDQYQSSCTNGYIKISPLGSTGTSLNVAITESDFLNMEQIYAGTSTPYTYQTYIQRVQLGKDTIQIGVDYEYYVYGDSVSFVGPYQLRAPQKQFVENQPQRVIFLGDFDSQWIQNNSNYTFNWFDYQAKYNRSSYDLIILLGDLAYDLESQNCERGDYFLRNLSTFTPYLPMLVTPGNHDTGNNTYFDYLKHSFYTPQLSQLNTPTSYYNFFSFDLGLVHFIALNCYWIVYGKATPEQKSTLLAAFESDLVDAYNNRDKVPWIVVFSHYPIYCSDSTDSQCYQNHISLKDYVDLIEKYQVQYYIGAHQHNYERDRPTINNLTATFDSDGPAEHQIWNSNAPVYIVEGAAGNDYFMPTTNYTAQPYTLFQSENRGVGVLTILNTTHLLFQQIATQTNTQEDYVYVIINQDQSKSSKVWIWVLVSILGIILILAGSFGFYYWRKKRTAQNQSTQEEYTQYRIL